MRRFEEAERAFEAAHDEDPRKVSIEGREIAFATVYHRTLARWVDRLVPDASEALRLAARCQHLRRHALAREAFPMDTAGYKRWRSTLALKHASDARAILAPLGYDEATIERVGDFLLKRGLRKDAEVASFEDAICLTFLEVEFPSFAAKHPDDKVVDILHKTWAKMTERGHEEALALAPSLPERLRVLVVRAVSPS